jgi:hypothetical protein
LSADAVGPADAILQLQRVLEETDQVNTLVRSSLDGYLRRIRALLDGALHQAVFQLVTDQRPDAFLALDDDQRRHLRARLSQLTARSREQLTIRRLVEQGLQRLRQQQTTLETFTPDDGEGFTAPLQGVKRPEIRLDLQNRPLLAGFDPGRLLGGPEPWSASDGGVDVDDRLDPPSDEDDLEDGFVPLDPGFDQPLPIPAEPAVARRWLGLADHALSVHLLELSDAVNRELMALDLLGEIPDPALLDAALEGQADARPAPPNLLRLAWPFEADQLAGVLLRSADLEFLDPPLRSQRQVLRRLDRQLARMARRHHHWQRRTAVRQAEEAWQQSNPRPPQPGAG